jgi:Arc/MetJ family transcription regulator
MDMLDDTPHGIYAVQVTRRTSINLDFDLVDEAKRVLGISETTETIHRSLQAVVRQARLQRLAERRFDLGESESVNREARTAKAPPVSLRSKASA